VIIAQSPVETSPPRVHSLFQILVGAMRRRQLRLQERFQIQSRFVAMEQRAWELTDPVPTKGLDPGSPPLLRPGRQRGSGWKEIKKTEAGGRTMGTPQARRHEHLRGD